MVTHFTLTVTANNLSFIDITIWQDLVAELGIQMIFFFVFFPFPFSAWYMLKS